MNADDRQLAWANVRFAGLTPIRELPPYVAVSAHPLVALLGEQLGQPNAGVPTAGAHGDRLVDVALLSEQLVGCRRKTRLHRAMTMHQWPIAVSESLS